MGKAESLQKKYGKLLEGVEVDTHRHLPLQIMLMGEFNAGKSSLTNALVGKDLLPVDIFQTTATINRIRYNPAQGFRVLGADDRVLLSSNSIERLQEFNADAGSFENIKWIEIGWPDLPEGLELIDTPGFNDPNPTRDTTFLSIVPHADLIVFVCDANQALKGSEVPYIKKYFLNALSRVYFVFNHSDTLANFDKIQAIYQSVENSLRQLITNAGEIYGEYGCSEVMNQIANIDIGSHIFFISALAELQEYQHSQIDPILKEKIESDFDKLRSNIFASVSQRDAIAEEWQLRTILNQLSLKYERASSTISALQDNRKQKDYVQKSIVDRIMRQRATYLKIQEALSNLPIQVGKFLQSESESGISRLKATIQSLGDDMGGAYLSQVFEQQLQGIIQRLVEGTKDICRNTLTQSLELSLGDIADIKTETEISIKSQYSRQLDLQKGGTVASIIAAAGWLLGPMGVVAGVVVSGVYYMNTLKEQRQAIDQAYEQIADNVCNMLSSVRGKILDSIDAMLKSFEAEIVKGAEKTQWELIELTEYASKNTDVLIGDLEKERELIRFGIRDCQLQLLPTRE